MIEILRKLKGMIDISWAKYRAFRVIFVISFLIFMVVSDIYIIYAFYQSSFIHAFSLIFILVVFGLKRGIFKRIANSLKHRQNILEE